MEIGGGEVGSAEVEAGFTAVEGAVTDEHEIEGFGGGGREVGEGVVEEREVVGAGGVEADGGEARLRALRETGPGGGLLAEVGGVLGFAGSTDDKEEILGAEGEGEEEDAEQTDQSDRTDRTDRTDPGWRGG
jgi:hypothetical protein